MRQLGVSNSQGLKPAPKLCTRSGLKYSSTWLGLGKPDHLSRAPGIAGGGLSLGPVLRHLTKCPTRRCNGSRCTRGQQTGVELDSWQALHWVGSSGLNLVPAPNMFASRLGVTLLEKAEFTSTRLEVRHWQLRRSVADEHFFQIQHRQAGFSNYPIRSRKLSEVG